MINLNRIPHRDITIIEDVADHVAYRTFIDGYTNHDLKQELILIGMKQYARTWDEDKQKEKNRERRDRNLRMYMKNLMKNRTHNIDRDTNEKVRKHNITITSVDPQNPSTIQLNRLDSNEIREIDFEGLGFSEDQVKVLMYIAGNDLGRGGATGSTKYTMSDETGLPVSRITQIIENFKRRSDLKDMLIDRM
jgi:hypothetical protein